MARFMDVHGGLVGVTEQQLLEAHRRDQAIEGEEGVHFEKAWLDPEMESAFGRQTTDSDRRSRRSGQPLASASQASRERPARRS